MSEAIFRTRLRLYIEVTSTRAGPCYLCRDRSLVSFQEFYWLASLKPQPWLCDSFALWFLRFVLHRFVFHGFVYYCLVFRHHVFRRIFTHDLVSSLHLPCRNWPKTEAMNNNNNSHNRNNYSVNKHRKRSEIIPPRSARDTSFSFFDSLVFSPKQKNETKQTTTGFQHAPTRNANSW